MGTDKRERQKAGRQARLEAARAAQVRAQRRRRLITFVIVGVLAVAGLAAYSTFAGDDEESASTTTTTPEFAYGATECAPTESPTEPVREFSDSFQDCLDPDQRYTAVFDTSEGEIRVRLDVEATPGTVNNFVNLTRNRYFDETLIFRTDPSLGLIQGGEADPGAPGPGYTIPDEGSGYTYAPGQLVMARTGDPNSASSQFFFAANEAAAALDAEGTYVVFGETNAAGLEVVTAILALAGDQPDPASGFVTPTREVTVNSIRIIERAPAETTTTTTAG